MEWRKVQQPGLIIRLLLGLQSSCFHYGQVMVVSAHTPTCATSLAVPGCLKFINSHAFNGAASLWMLFSMSFRKLPVTSARCRTCPPLQLGDNFPCTCNAIVLTCSSMQVAPVAPPLLLVREVAEIRV